MNLLYAYDSKLRNGYSGRKDIEIFQQLYQIDIDPFLVDRTQNIKWPYYCQLLDCNQLPDFDLPVLSFADCCIARAKELLGKDNKIYLMWSGGIDSTAMLISFLTAGRSLDQVTIALNDDSIREYPNFYHLHIRSKFDLISIEELMLRASTTGLDGIMISAEHADQLFGSPLANLIHQKLGADFLYQPATSDVITGLLRKFNLDPLSAKCIDDLYRLTFTHSPRPIQNVWDWAWWHGFNFKWQQIGLKLKTRLLENVDLITFYSDTNFQRWSANQRPDLHSMESLKNTAKQVILDYTNDRHYFDHKIKHPSTTLYYAKQNSPAILENGKKLDFGQFDFLDYYDPGNSIAKWLNNH